MSNKFILDHEDIDLFKNSIGKTKLLKQDTVIHKPQKRSQKLIENQKIQHEKVNNEFYFSDDYQPLLQEDPIRYSRENSDPNELKKLRRGFYAPEFFLDLHGLTLQEAKKEIAALIAVCLKENANCACIMYGHGKNILKKQTPMWLAQHPNIICFHQAPKEFGGSAALLILFDTINN
ncbi:MULTISPECIES: endonuclease SmrB [unclassified Gilliamella]|uniref:endonuclease SmrB n=1 Tax=unclassified Gilliamella TaxID=2685620 RepID=UPI002269AA09|nr:MULTISPECIES: endonuclease SmrB [unclassified Gilliamella]MCX8597878.1 endonuclease SmrB [Gilliamella sp. B3493]MCX8599489.1 endonuclease SmrB [Gilliamella sp. B3486]MCX8689880.1 endonuclease SmrB [Gilliamella sp. B2973]MCX8705478.1 endonuclease SmrB [Gilliamella sp. B3127]